MKLVWYLNNARGLPLKKKIISRLKAYHGVTVAATSLTGLEGNHRDFDLPLTGFLHTGCPHHYRFAEDGETEEEFASRLATELDALIEQGRTRHGRRFHCRAGHGRRRSHIVPPRTYFPKIMAVCAKHDLFVISDEVICGFGRLGTWFGCEKLDFKPQALSVAKALSSAYLPIAAVMMPGCSMYEALLAESNKIGAFGHGFTYGGHPVAAAVALKAIEIYGRDRIIENTAKRAPLFQGRLRLLGQHPLVGEARGLGLIGGVELVADKLTKRAFNPRHGVGPRAVRFAEEEGAAGAPWAAMATPQNPVPTACDQSAANRGTVREATSGARQNARLGDERKAG